MKLHLQDTKSSMITPIPIGLQMNMLNVDLEGGNDTSINMTDICLPDNYYCTVTTYDLCTIDTWDEVEKVCMNTPVTCSESQSRDPTDGYNRL
jgi:hypothetical protein